MNRNFREMGQRDIYGHLNLIHLAYVHGIVHDEPWTMEAATLIVVIISKYRHFVNI